MKNHIAFGLCALLLATAGCSDATAPSGERSKQPSGGMDGTTQATPEQNPGETKETPVQVVVEKPWQPGAFQYGIQLYWHRGTLKQDEVDGRILDHLDYIVGLGANSLGVTFPIYTDGAFPSRVYRGPETPSMSTLRSLTQQARARGLRVMLRPLIDEENIMTTPSAWRGSIQPPDANAWFASYARTLKPYLRLAQGQAVDEFVLGTELFTLQDQTASWIKLRNMATRTFDGRVSYGLNWDGFTVPPPFQEFGLDLYPSIDLADDAPVALIGQKLAEWLLQQPLPMRQRITLQEVGIPAQDGVYRQPWLWGSGNEQLNLEVQKNWFAAACLAARNTRVQGLYYWMVDSNVDPTEMYPETDPAGSFMGRPAERSIKDCFERSR